VSFLQASKTTVIVFTDYLGCSLAAVVYMSCVLAEFAEEFGVSIFQVGGKGGDVWLSGFFEDSFSFLPYHPNHLGPEFACPILFSFSLSVCG